jgi:tetratricopeptide (TPR) repeat protein
MGFFTGPFGIAKRILGFLYGNVSKVVFLGLAFVVLYFVFADRRQPLLTLAAFVATNGVEDHGLNGDIVVGRLKTALAKITDNDSADAHTAERVLSFRNTGDRCELKSRVQIGNERDKPATNAFDSLANGNLGSIDIDIPGTGLSLPQVERILRQLTRSRDIVVSGDLMMIQDNAKGETISKAGAGIVLATLANPASEKDAARDDLLITVRVSGLGDLKILRATARTGDIDPTIEALARQLARLVDPIALARYHIERCEMTAADSILQTCLRPDSRLCDDNSKAEARMLEGLELLYSAEYDRATAAFELAIAGPLDRHDAAKAYYYLAMGRYFQDRIDAALAATERSLSLEPTGFDARYLRGFLLRYQLRWTEGRREFESLVIDQIDNVLRQPESAVPELAEAMSVFRRLRDAILRAQVRPFPIEDEVEAARTVDVLAQAPDSPPILTAVNDLEGSVADYARALQDLRSAIEGLSYSFSLQRDEKAAIAKSGGQYQICFSDQDTADWPTSQLVYCSVYADVGTNVEWSMSRSRMLLKDPRVQDLQFDDDPDLWLMSRIATLTYEDADDRPRSENSALLSAISSVGQSDDLKKYHWFLGVAYLHRFYLTTDPSDLNAALDEFDKVPREDPAAKSAKIVAAYSRAMQPSCSGDSDGLSAEPTVSDIQDTLRFPSSVSRMLRGMILACHGQQELATEMFRMAANDFYAEPVWSDGMSAIAPECSTPDKICRSDVDFRESIQKSLRDVAEDPSPWLKPNYGYVSYVLAQALFKADDRTAALSLVDRRSDRIYPRLDIRRFLFQADALAAQGREDKGRDLLVSWLHRYGQNADIMMRLARSQIALGAYGDAEETLESAAYQRRLNHSDADIYSEGDILFDLGRAVAGQAAERTGEAVDLYRAGLANNAHGSAAQYQTVIDAYCTLGRLDEAERFRADTLAAARVTSEDALTLCPKTAGMAGN